LKSRNSNGDSILLATEKVSKRTCLFVVNIAVLVLANIAGCAPAPTWEVAHPTTGQVTLKGRPAADVELSFFPEDPSFPDTVRPRAKTKEDGSFVAWTYVQGDGVPAGSYKVTLIRNSVAVSKDTIVAKPNDLPAKYSMRDSTDLSVKIVAGKNELQPFHLK
jgi:hypothetical protein